MSGANIPRPCETTVGRPSLAANAITLAFHINVATIARTATMKFSHTEENRDGRRSGCSY